MSDRFATLAANRAATLPAVRGAFDMRARSPGAVESGFLLQEDGSYLLQEDGSKIIITEVVYA